MDRLIQEESELIFLTLNKADPFRHKKTKKKGLLPEPCNQPHGLLPLTASGAPCVLQGHVLQSQMWKEASLRSHSSPESPNKGLPYKNEGNSFLMSKAFYTDKVYSSQLLCILHSCIPPPFTCKIKFLGHFCRIFASQL